jgi:glycosyltransferase involved in cell wall biosynthesis
LRVPWDLIWRLGRIHPDVIIAGELGANAAQATLYKWQHREARLVIWATLSEHTEQGRGILREQLRRWILPRADAVLVNGASGARYVQRFGVPKERIFLVPQTTEIQTFMCASLQRPVATARRLFFSGQLIERKGLVPFLQVLARWAQLHPGERVEFWLLGDGPQRTALARLPLPGNVELRFLGTADYDRLPHFYAQAGILAFPTLADEWGMVVNEALATGMPVLGSVHSQAVEELVKDGENGWTFRPDHPEEMYGALDRALTVSEEQLNRMRANARESIRRLTPEFVAERITEAILFARANPVP